METEKPDTTAASPAATFVMPAFNAAPYIAQAIDSIQSQTVDDWRLIIADDCSSDETRAIADDYARRDTRITVVHTDSQSGNAFLPRCKAILEAETRFIAPLDADDRIEPRYLEKLLREQRRTDAPCVYPTMWRMCGDKARSRVPADDSFYGTCLPGASCVRYTLDGWRINCNGGLIDRALYIKAANHTADEVLHSFSDEMLTRILLICASSVAFSDATYFYRTDNESVTRCRSVKAFDYLRNNFSLSCAIPRWFGRRSEEHTLIQRQNFHGIFDAWRLLSNGRDFTKKERTDIDRLIFLCEFVVDVTMLEQHVSPRYLRLFRARFLPRRSLLRLLDRHFGRR